MSMEIEREKADVTSLSVIRQLASCNNTSRSRALRRLATWLPSQLEISDEDMKKLWKGIFYCVWHSDKAINQSQLINKLSSLLVSLNLSLSIQYFTVFLLTVRREWSGIDGLRLDKFYLLIRRFVNCMFLLLKKNGWDLELTQRLTCILGGNTFFADDNKLLGNGVNYHIASVFLEELKCFLPVKEETLEIIFKPFFSVMGKCKDKVLLGKVRCNVFDLLLKMGKSLLKQRKDCVGGDVGDDEVVNFGSIALTMGFAAKFYELGSSPDCVQGNRKVLFSLHEEFLKLEKDLEVSGIQISIPNVTIEDDDEMPELVPIAAADESQAISYNLLLEAPAVVAEGVKKSSKKKKKKEAKEGSDRGSNRKRKMTSEKDNDNGNVVIADGESLSNGLMSDVNNINFTEYFKSNLQMEFEKVAEEEGLDKDGDTSLLDSSPIVSLKSATIAKKRKRARSVDRHEPKVPDLSEQGGAALKSGEKSAKKVRFSIKNNLVWKPQSPLPPQSVRIPPSVTPRGSALKKGVPPGPIREMPPATKRMKQKKKGRKVMKTTSPAVKRLRKLQKLSI